MLLCKSMIIKEPLSAWINARRTVDSRYLEFDGTMENIWVNRSSTQEELRKPEV